MGHVSGALPMLGCPNVAQILTILFQCVSCMSPNFIKVEQVEYAFDGHLYRLVEARN